MTTIEKNKLIAKFMGLDIITDGISFFNAEYKSMKRYHADWNCLMEVVEKIENYNHGSTLFIIEDERCHVNSQNGFEIDSVGHTKKEAVYNACVEFIKWYNKNK